MKQAAIKWLVEAKDLSELIHSHGGGTMGRLGKGPGGFLHKSVSTCDR